MTKKISKVDGARRQLETAIDLHFQNADSLSVHTLAWAAFKVLFDLYPHKNGDGFDQQLESVIQRLGWNKLAAVGNFLKHADKDPEAFLASHHPLQAMVIISFAVMLYKRVADGPNAKMMAFDAWYEWLEAEALGIEELDQNKERVARHNAEREAIRALPFDEQIKIGRKNYEYVVGNYDRISEATEKAKGAGKSLQELLDAAYSGEG